MPVLYIYLRFFTFVRLKPDMNILKKVFRFFFTIYGFAIFLFWMFILMPLFIYAFLLEREKGGNLVYSISRFWADAFFFMLGIRYSNIDEVPTDINERIYFCK